MAETGYEPTRHQNESLTPRERQILELMAHNLSNQEIASRLFISSASVKWYTHQIYLKLGFTDRRLSLVKAQDLGTMGQTHPQLAPQPHNFPIPLTSFIGRERVLTDICRLVAKSTSRLVTLTGAGGVGKTRLALRAAEEMNGSYPQGIWWVDLSAQNDLALVGQTIALGFGLQINQNRPVETILQDFLQGKRLLLILDNCEHLVEDCARTANNLLTRNRELSILTTSREVLGVEGEKVFNVPPMSIPGSEEALKLPDLLQYESISLFVERAQAASAGFELLEGNAAAVAEICRRLDGIPLAIELAAARIRLLSPAQIAQRLNDVFHLLNRGSRTALARHKTLRALIDWSYNLLSKEERHLFRQLAVFTGSWTLEALESVWVCPPEPGSGAVVGGALATEDSPMELLNQLIDKSLVQAIPSETGPCRFRMLETIRQYAEEQLEHSGQQAATRDRHLAYYLTLAQSYEPLLHTDKIIELLDQLSLEMDNIHGAVAWAISKNDSQGAEKALKIINALFYFWYLRSLFSEVEDWVKRAIHLLQDDPQSTELKAWSLLILALFKSQYTELSSEVFKHLNLCISLYRQTRERFENRLKLAMALAERKFIYLINLDVLPPGTVYDDQHARQDEEESLAIVRNWIGPAGSASGWFVPWIYWTLAYADGFRTPAFSADSEVRGKVYDWLQSAYEISARLGDQVNELMILLVFAGIYRYDDIENCKFYAQRGIALAKRLCDQKTLADILCMQGIAFYLSNQYQEMEANFYEVTQIGCQVGDVAHQIYGTRMQGFAAVLQDDRKKARAYLEKALILSMSHQDTPGLLSTFIGLSGLAAQGDQGQDAVRILSFVQHQYQNLLKPLSRFDQMEFERIETRLKANLKEAEFAALWAEGQGMNLEDATHQALMLAEAHD